MSEKNIYQRLIEVQKKVQTVFKNETVKLHEKDKGYRAVSHDDVASLLHLPLAEAGIVLLPDVVEFQNSSFEKKNSFGNLTTWYRTDIKIKVKWINADKPDDFIESTGASFAMDTSDKSFAKAYSLALKIVLLKVHLLESRDQEEQRVFEDENQNKQNIQSTKKSDQSRSSYQKFSGDPKNYVSKLTKNKKLGELDHAQLAKIREWTTAQLKAKPRPKNIAEIADLHENVKKMQTDLPPADQVPEFEPQDFPQDEQLPPEAYHDNPFDEFQEMQPLTSAPKASETPNLAPPSGQKTKSDDGPGAFILPKMELPRGYHNLHGKRLDSFQPAVLDTYMKAIQAESLKVPKPPNVAEMFGVIGKIKAYLETF